MLSTKRALLVFINCTITCHKGIMGWNSASITWKSASVTAWKLSAGSPSSCDDIRALFCRVPTEKPKRHILALAAASQCRYWLSLHLCSFFDLLNAFRLRCVGGNTLSIVFFSVSSVFLQVQALQAGLILTLALTSPNVVSCFIF